MKRPRRHHTSAFNPKVALEAVKGEQTLAELTQKFDVHATQIAAWKRALRILCGSRKYLCTE